MKKFSRIMDIICDIAKYVCAFFLALMLIVSLVEIFRRYLMGLD